MSFWEMILLYFDIFGLPFQSDIVKHNELKIMPNEKKIFKNCWRVSHPDLEGLVGDAMRWRKEVDRARCAPDAQEDVRDAAVDDDVDDAPAHHRVAAVAGLTLDKLQLGASGAVQQALALQQALNTHTHTPYTLHTYIKYSFIYLIQSHQHNSTECSRTSGPY